ATLVARLAKQLAVLLLRHALAALLDDGTHGTNLDLDTCVRQRLTHSGLAYSASGLIVIFEDVAACELGLLHEGLDGLLGHTERSTEPYSGQFARVDSAVHRHSRDADHLRELSYGEERSACSTVRCHVSVCSLFKTSP